jgi:hypothetical protein
MSSVIQKKNRLRTHNCPTRVAFYVEANNGCACAVSRDHANAELEFRWDFDREPSGSRLRYQRTVGRSVNHCDVSKGLPR